MEIKKVNEILISIEATIRDSMKKMDEGAMGIILVVDEHKMLRGTVTDGDIRRAILNGVDLDQCIYTIMQVNFVYVTNKNVKEQEVKRIFDYRLIKQLPILNEYKQPVGIILIEDMLLQPQKQNYVLIMAGGLGSRLKPLTDEIPKPMLKVGDKPILETIIGQFKKHGYTNFLISVNYKSHLIEDYFQDGSSFGVNIEYIREKEVKGTAGSIALAKQYLDKPFFVINGDILTNMNFSNFLSFHSEGKNDLTIASRQFSMQVPYGVLNYNNEQIYSIDEKPEFTYSINAGIYILNPYIVEYIPENATSFAMTDLIELALKNQHKVGNYPIREYWIDIGRVQDYYKANEDIYQFFGE